MKDIAKCIKEYRQINKMSQKQLARELGIGQTAIANYEKGIRSPSFNQVVKMSEIFNVSVDKFLSLTKEKSQVTASQILKLLRNNDEASIYELFDSHHYSDDQVVEILEKPIKESLYQIGVMWYEGIISIAKEHQYSNILTNLISMISKKKDRRRIDETYKALTITYKDELHTIGLKYIEEYLSILGIQSIYVGNNTPTESVNDIIKEERVNLIMISLTMDGYLNSLKEFIDELKKNDSSLKVIVGGQAFFGNTKWFEVGADGCASDFKTLKNEINRLKKEEGY